MHQPTRREPTYVLGSSDAETWRLMIQADLYGQTTRRFLEDAGVTSSMRVLDVGSGAGDVTFLAAELVGPSGAVVGVDVNPAVLATARARALAEGRDNVVFVEGDCRTAALDHDFDAAIGRFVLMHTSDASEALRAIVARVRSGGIVAFAEGDFATALGYAQAGPAGLVRSLWDWAAELWRRLELPIAMAPVLCRAFAEAGLGMPHMFLHSPLGCRDDWLGYEVDAESARSIVPLLERFGIVTGEVLDVDTLADRYRAEVVRTGFPFMLLPLVTAWARKPVS